MIWAWAVYVCGLEMDGGIGAAKAHAISWAELLAADSVHSPAHYHLPLLLLALFPSLSPVASPAFIRETQSKQ